MNPVQSAQNGKPTEAKQLVLKDIHNKWSKFSDQEISAIKGKDDLVTQVQAKYSLDQPQALREVNTLLNGRAF